MIRLIDSETKKELMNKKRSGGGKGAATEARGAGGRGAAEDDEVVVGDVSAETAEGAASAAGEPGSDEVYRLSEELERLNDRHLRLAAEFDNYRRRSTNQLSEAGARAQAELVGRLLDVVDDFERIASLGPEQATVHSLLEGVDLVRRKLEQVLVSAGLEVVEAEGEPFDPNSMEAMIREPADRPEEDDTVGSVLQRGFRFRGHLVRPARVSVRKHDG